MAITINAAGTYLVTRLSNADTLTGWSANTLEGSGGGANLFASVGSIDLVQEGSGAVASGANKQRVALRYTFTSRDMTGENAYIWGAFLAAGSAFTKANGGLQIELGTGGNFNYYNVAGSDTYSGGFVKWAVDAAKTPFENSGTAATISAIDSIGFVCDVGGATTRFDNMVADALDVGTGLTFQGTTTTDKLFLESATVDEATAIGVLGLSNGIIFAQGSLEFSGTAQNSVGETLVFTDTLLGAYTYQFDITGGVIFTNTSVLSSGGIDFNFNSTAATSLSMTGGAISGFNTLATKLGQEFDGVVFSAGGTSVIADITSGGAFNQCGAISFIDSGKLFQVVLNEPTAPVVVSNLNLVDDCSFVSDGTGYAVNLGTISSNISMTWNSSATGYSGSNGATGNETILVNVATGIVLTINDEGTGLTYNNTGAGTVSIVTNSVTVRVIAQTGNATAIENTRVLLKKVVGGAVVLSGVTNASGIIEDTAYTYTTDEAVEGWARKSSVSPYYKQGPISGTITSTGFSGTAILQLDE
jgi:hypothetical protein